MQVELEHVPLPGYNIQSLFRVLPQHTVALTCAKALELPQNGFLRGNQDYEIRTFPEFVDCPIHFPRREDGIEFLVRASTGNDL